jgi:hypothetical protein
VLPKIPFDCTPKVLNKVEFTVKFGEEDAKVTRIFNDLLDERLLLNKIGLKIKDVLCTAVSCPTSALSHWYHRSIILFLSL